MANKWRICYPSLVPPENQDLILTPQALAELRRRLSMLSDPGLADAYREAHKDCTLSGKRIPPASAIQRLVTAWKVMMRMQRK